MKYLTTLAAVCLPILLLAYPGPPVHFLKSNPAEVQQLAAQQGKLYFIHFTAEWCMPCQWMDQHAFRDPSLTAFLEKNYLALRADVDQPEGQSLQGQYSVRILPSLLVFSAQGQLLGRHDGAMGPEALLAQLKAYRRPVTLQAIQEEDILPSPRPSFALSRPALIPDVQVAPPRAVSTVSPPQPITAKPPASSSPNAYQQPQFTIQVGVFSSYNNAVRQCAALEAKANQRTEIAPCQLNGQNLYKVFLGRFGHQAEANARLKELRLHHIEGFVKIIDK